MRKFKRIRVLQALKTNCPRTGSESISFEKVWWVLADWLKHNLSKQIAIITQLQKGMQSHNIIKRKHSVTGQNNTLLCIPTVQSVLGSHPSDSCLEGYRPI